MQTLRENLRANVRETARLFASRAAAEEFQSQVPHVFAPTELFCKWFDDTYMPQDPDFVGAFSPSELHAISALGTSLDKLASESGDPPPPLEALFNLPSWAEVQRNAAAVLETVSA